MVSVERDIAKNGSARVYEEGPAKLFIGGLPRETSTQHLKDHFSKYGHLVDCIVMRWSDGRSRGFGYITYDNNNSANEALQVPQTLDGRVVDVKRAVPGTNKLFVGGLPQGLAAAELRTYFSNFGPVSDAVVMMDSATGRSRGFGFVCFAPGPEGATAISGALAKYDQHQLRGKWIEVKSAAPAQDLNKAGGDSPPEMFLPPSTPSSLHSAPMTPMSHFSSPRHAFGYNSQMPMVSSPHSLLQQRHQVPFMNANAFEFVPTAEDLMYSHLMQADHYAQQQQMPHALFPGGRPPATPHSVRSPTNLQKPAHMGMPSFDQLAFAAARSMDHEENMVPPPPQYVAAVEPQWPLFALPPSSLEQQSPPLVPSGVAAAGFAPASGFVPATGFGANVATPVISPKVGAARPPPGLEDVEATNIFVDAAAPICVEILPEMKDMSTQTEGPACRACGAAFGCAGKCPWSRDKLLGMREAFLRTKISPKDSGALKAVRYQDTSAARKKVGGA